MIIRENACEDDKQLIISYAYPNKPVKSATVARYIKLFLMDAGIDITVFTPHSTRAASTSKANNLGCLSRILQKLQGGKVVVLSRDITNFQSRKTWERKFYKIT